MQSTHNPLPTLEELRREEDRLDWLENHRPPHRMRRRLVSTRAHVLPVRLEHLVALLAARLHIG